MGRVGNFVVCTIYKIQYIHTYIYPIQGDPNQNLYFWRADIVFELHKIEPIELERYKYELTKKELNKYDLLQNTSQGSTHL